MKKTILLLIATILVLCSTMPLSANASANDSPSRQINVVYDDSGSMYSSGGSNVDTWCRAKYSMEVFAAMLGERDRMHVYYMSDYQDGQSKPARLQLDGKDGAAENVKKVHNETTHAGNTPFSSVKKAYKDLQSVNADEKWLVILTDGAFQGVSGQEGMDSFFGQKNDNIGVIFLGIGADVPGITEHHDKDIYCFKASDSRAVLENITQICTIVFSSNKLVVNPSTKTFSFDIPVGELVVFAQGGENVRISGIKNGSQEYGSSKAPVEVKYSPCDAVGRNNQPVTDLHGFLAVFIDDFMPGNYTVEVSGAETVEVYYKPNIDIAVSLTDSSGREVMGLSEIEAGEYTLDMCFVKAGTNERINNSSLLGDVSFDAAVTKNGVLLDQVFHSGDKITAEEGSMIIDVTARYLTYYSLSSVKNFSVYKDNHVSFSVVDDPTFDVTSNGIDPEKYILIHADIDGHTPTKEQWDNMELPVVKLTSGQGEYDIDIPVLVKGNNPGDLMLYPKLSRTEPTEGTYGNFGYSLSYEQSIGEERWSGALEGVAKLNDTTKGNAQTIKTLMQVSDITSAAFSNDDQKIIVEISDDWTWNLVSRIIDFKVYGDKKNKCNIVPVRVNQVLGQILSQFSLMPELNYAYRELFSNKGATFYAESFRPDNEEEYISQFINNHPAAIPLTHMHTGKGDFFFYSADEEDDIHVKAEMPDTGYRLKLNRNYWIAKKNVVILGHNSNCKYIMQGFASFQNEWKRADGEPILQIIVIDDEQSLKAMDYYKQYPFVIRTVAANIFDRDLICSTIEEFVESNDEDTSVLILSDDSALKEDIDSNTLANLVYVQDIITRKKKTDPNFDPESIDVIVEIIDPKHHDVVSSYSVDNVVISNRYISKMITQIGEKESIFDFYRDILTYDEAEGNFDSKEIYAKKVDSFFDEVPAECTESELVRSIWFASIDPAIPAEKRYPTLALGYVKPGGKVSLFGRDQTKKKVKLEKRDKILVFTNH